MESPSAPIGYQRIITASLITVLGWGFGWIISVIFTVWLTTDTAVSLQSVVGFNLLFGLIAISASLVGLGTAGVRLTRRYWLVLYAVWGIGSFSLSFLVYAIGVVPLANVTVLLPYLIILFGLTFGWLQAPSMRNLEGFKITLFWIGAGILYQVLLRIQFMSVIIDATPLGVMLTAYIGSAGMLMTIRHYQASLYPVDQSEAVQLAKLITSSAQNATFEVIHDTRKAKPKGKPKPWVGIPHIRLYVSSLIGALVLAIIITSLITPMHEVHVVSVVTSTPLISSSISENSGLLPSTVARLPWFAQAITKSPVGAIAENVHVTVSDRYYDYKVQQWWYRVTSVAGQSADAWESQLTELEDPAVATPINGPVPIGGEAYHIRNRTYDGSRWLITLIAPDGLLHTVDADVLGWERVGVPLPPVPFMDLVGNRKAILMTRDRIGSIGAGSSVWLFSIIWNEGKPPMYQIGMKVNDNIITALASAAQLVDTPPFTPTPSFTSTPKVG